MMTLTLELTPAQETQLRAKAAAAGQDLATYLLSLAAVAIQENGIQESGNEEANDTGTEASRDGSAYDLFKDLLGGWGSGGGNLSEQSGAAVGVSHEG